MTKMDFSDMNSPDPAKHGGFAGGATTFDPSMVEQFIDDFAKKFGYPGENPSAADAGADAADE